MKNFKKKVSYKSVRTYWDGTCEQIIAYASVERCSWEVKSGETSYITFLHLDILCPNKEVEKLYQKINNNQDFCLRKEMYGCIKNFTYTKRYDANYTGTEIISRYNEIYLRFSLCIPEELTLTDDELLEKIKNSYNIVADVIWETCKEYLKEELENKKAELFNTLLVEKTLKSLDVEQIKNEYKEYSDKQNEKLVKLFEVLLKQPVEKIQIIEAE